MPGVTVNTAAAHMRDRSPHPVFECRQGEGRVVRFIDDAVRAVSLQPDAPCTVFLIIF